MTETQQIIEFVRQMSPGALRLAKTVSLAVRVEPALLRKARLELLPDVDAGAEADLWFSPLVESQSPLGLVLLQEVAEELRQEFFQQERQLFDEAWRLLKEFRRNAHPTIRLEEKLIRLSLTDAGEAGRQASEEIEESLLQVLAAMAMNQEAEGIARWALRALPRLPESVRSKPAAAMLAMGASVRLDGRRVLEGELPPDAFEKYLPWLLPENIPRVGVGVRRTQYGVEFGDTSLENAHKILLPKTNPLVIELLWGSGKQRQSRRLAITPGSRLPVHLTADQIELRTALGESYLLVLEAGEGTWAGKDAPPIPDFSELRTRHRPFFGREDLMKRLEQEIWGRRGESAGKFIVLAGSAGTGKTALLSHFLDYHERRGHSIPHLFNLRNFTPDSARQALAAQLEKFYPELVGTADYSSSANPQDRLFDLLAKFPSAKLPPIKEKLVLLLDGLNEMENFDALLSFQRPLLPANVIVLFSTRPTEEYRKWKENKKLREQTLELDLDSPEWDASNKQACQAFWDYHARQLKPPLGDDLLEFFNRQADGNMLYTKLAHEWLLAQPPEARRVESLPQYLRSSQAERAEQRHIRWLQGALNQVLNLSLTVDGISGPQTREAVFRFQQQQGLVTDGIFDLATEAALIKVGVAPITKDAADLSICLIHDEVDREVVDQITHFLNDRNFQVLLWPKPNGKQQVDYLRENLMYCDAVLIYCGQASDAWLRARIMDLLRFPTSSHKPLLTSAIYLGPPETELKQRSRENDHIVIKNYGIFDGESLKPFLEAIRQRSMRAESYDE